jgi:hypothetical protein
LLLLFISNPSLFRRKRLAVKAPSSKRAKPSPAAIPHTPEVPIPSPARNDIDMEDAGGPFDSMPETNPTNEAAANDVIQSKKDSGSFQDKVADSPAGGGGQFFFGREAT